jgi:Cu+-exporting ATPase
VAVPGPATLAGAGSGHGSAAEATPLAPAVDDIVLLDPVCGMTVDREHARHLAEHDGVVYAFCSMGCRTAFMKEPGAYVPGSTTAQA